MQTPDDKVVTLMWPTSRLLDMAQTLHLSGQTEMASVICEEILLVDRSHSKAALLFHQICWGANESEALEIEANLKLAWANFNEAKWTEVIDQTEALLIDTPSVDEALLLQALAHYNVQNVKKAKITASSATAKNLFDAQHLVSLGVLLHDLGAYSAAITAFQRSTKLLPNAQTFANLGAALLAAGEVHKAYTTLKIAVEYGPKSHHALNNLAAACFDLGLLIECEDFSIRALDIAPSNASSLTNLGNTYLTQKRWSEAADVFEESLSVQPSNWDQRSKLLFCLQQNADWGRLENHKQYFSDHFRQTTSKVAPNPWVLLSTFDDPELHQIAAMRHAARFNAISQGNKRPLIEPRGNRPINIGYFSADFHDHPTTQLISSVLSHHDRGKFAVHTFSFGPDRQDKYRSRVHSASDHFYDVEKFSNERIAHLSKQIGIDIAIDLNGYTKNHRAPIFAYRAAPIQIQYLGYPGTLMMDEIDAVIADHFVLPEGSEKFFSEKILRLPRCYQVNDANFDILDQHCSRAECGLPDEVLVLACFNSVHKIQRETFSLWMKIMREVENSVLWLFCENHTAQKNILAYAHSLGVNDDRIFWANRVGRPAHLARHCHVDLFLDTLPYNAHTTASDALRMGVPLITCPGRSFASRVGGSLLSSLGLDQLIATDSESYFRIAKKLCNDHARRLEVSNKIMQNSKEFSVFDAHVFTKNFETCLLSFFDHEANR
jgi:protein O-GlcNAc transferase